MNYKSRIDGDLFTSMHKVHELESHMADWLYVYRTFLAFCESSLELFGQDVKKAWQKGTVLSQTYLIFS